MICLIALCLLDVGLYIRFVFQPRSFLRFVLFAYLLGIILFYEEIPASLAEYHW